MTLVELGLKRGKVPWVPITPTPDPGITGRLIQGTRSVARINLVRLIVQFQFCLSPPCRVETRRRCIGVAAKRLFSFTRLSFLFPSIIFFFFLVLFLSLSRGRTTMAYERCERLALNERNRKDAEEEEERRPRERAVSLRRQKVRLITGRPQVLVKPWQRQLSAPKATHGFTEVYARRGLFAPEKTRVGRRSVG